MQTITVNLERAHHKLGDLLDEVTRGKLVVLEHGTKRKAMALLVPPEYRARIERMIAEDERADKVTKGEG